MVWGKSGQSWQLKVRQFQQTHMHKNKYTLKGKEEIHTEILYIHKKHPANICTHTHCPLLLGFVNKFSLPDAKHQISLLCKPNQVGFNIANSILALIGLEKRGCFTVQHIIMGGGFIVVYVYHYHRKCVPMHSSTWIATSKKCTSYGTADKDRVLVRLISTRFPSLVLTISKSQGMREKKIELEWGVGAGSTCTYTLRPFTSDNVCNLHNNVIIICLILSSIVPPYVSSSTKSASDCFGKALAI